MIRRAVGLVAGAAVVALSVVGGSVAAQAADEVNYFYAVGQVTLDGSCSDGVATFTVQVPQLSIETSTGGGFAVGGESSQVEQYTAGQVIEGFSRSVQLPLPVIAEGATETLDVSYWFHDQATTLAVRSFTFGSECNAGPTPDPGEPAMEFKLGVPPGTTDLAYDVAVDVGDAEGPVVVQVKGGGVVLTELSFVESGSQYGTLPYPCGVTDFSVTFADGTGGGTRTLVAPCAAFSGGGLTPVAGVSATVSPTTIAQGGTTTVSASGLQPGQKVEVWLHSTPILLVSGTADAAGAFVHQVRIPADTVVGAHRIEVRAADSAFVDITVTPALAETGASSSASVWPVVAAAASLMLLGAVVLMLRRRLAVR